MLSDVLRNVSRDFVITLMPMTYNNFFDRIKSLFSERIGELPCAYIYNCQHLFDKIFVCIDSNP